MINRIIVNYLEENKRLVVPGLGAFLKKDATDVVFVEFLKKDDGVLSSLLCENLGVETDEATTMISNYIAVINRQLHSVGRFVIEGLGELELNSNGVCDLVYDVSKREDANWLKIQDSETSSEKVMKEAEQTIERIEKIEAEKPIDVKPVVAPLATPVAEPVKPAPIPAKPAPAVVSTPAVAVPAPKSTPAPVVKPKVVSTATAVSQLDSLKTTSTTPPTYRVASNVNSGMGGYVVKRKAKMDSIMIIAIVVAVFAILALVYGMFMQSETTDNLLDSTPVEQTVEMPQQDSPNEK